MQSKKIKEAVKKGKGPFAVIMNIVTGANWSGNVPTSSNAGTASSAAVTTTGECGVITSEALTTATNITAIITVTNLKVVPGTAIRATLMDYTGVFSTNGVPVIGVDAIDTTAHTFIITISNCSANALAGTVKIFYEIITLPSNAS